MWPWLVVQNHVGKAARDGRCLLVPLVVLVDPVAQAAQAALRMNHPAWNLPVLLRFPDLQADRMAVLSKAQGPA